MIAKIHLILRFSPDRLIYAIYFDIRMVIMSHKKHGNNDHVLFV